MNRSARTNALSGCLLYALATLPLTALIVTGTVWLERLGVWADLWSDGINVICCFAPCVGMALPLGLMLHFMSLRRGTIGHHLVQMTDHRGSGLLDICLLVGALTVSLVSLFLLPPTNLVVYLPAVLVLVAIAGRWTLRNLTAIVPFDEAGQGADLAALGQQSHLTADDIRDYNLPPRSLPITAANAAGPLGQLQSGPWRLEFQGATMQAGKDPAWLVLRLAGLVTNLNSAPASLDALPKLTVRDSQDREISPRQVAVTPMTTPLKLEAGASATLAPDASARLTVTFDVAATEQAFDLLARSRELAPGEEIVVPF
jgi:hypothetical protein